MIIHEDIKEIKEELKRIWHELSCLGSQLVYIKNLLEKIKDESI